VKVVPSAQIARVWFGGVERAEDALKLWAFSSQVGCREGEFSFDER